MRTPWIYASAVLSLSLGLLACEEENKKITNPRPGPNNINPNNTNPNNTNPNNTNPNNTNPNNTNPNNTNACQGTAQEAETFTQGLHAALCQKLIGCADHADVVFSYFTIQGISTVQQCQQLLAAQLGSPKQHAAAVSTGKATFDKCQAQACERGPLADLTCGELLRFVPANIDTYKPFQACTDAFGGKGNAGQGCTINAECGQGLACDREDVLDSSVMVACQGACRPAVAQVEGSCQGSNCTSDQYCGDPNNGICFPRKDAGEACTASEQCKTNARCDEATSKCVALRGGQASGAACDYEATFCGPGLICDADNGSMCRALFMPGEDCPGLGCAWGSTCDPGSTKCQTTLPAGSACGFDAQCQSLRCANGTCADVNALCP